MKINEIFYSLQGEGYFTGTAAVFLRMSGCNLRCPFCDTKHQEGREMSVEEIVREVGKYPARHIVITGGEPVLQITKELTDALHREQFYIQIETNGSLPLKEAIEIDWITCSPKGHAMGSCQPGMDCGVNIQRIDELKVLYTGNENEIAQTLLSIPDPTMIKEFRLQPLDTGNPAINERITHQAINYILNHTQWKLSLQTHKILKVQ